MRVVVGLCFIAAALILGALVSEGAPPRIDEHVARHAAETIGSGLGAPLRATSNALRPPWPWILGAALALVALWLRGWRAALVVALAAAAGLVASKGLKSAFERRRPTAELVGDRAHDTRTSYPSGHVTWAAASFGGLALVLARRRGKATAGFLVAVAAPAIVCVGAARIYLGRHYLTDVAGSILLGLGLAIFFTGLLRPR